MTRENKTRKTVREREIEETYTITDVEEVDEEIPGIRCDFCTNWYEENEVDFKELVEDPRIKTPNFQHGIRLYELAEILKTKRVSDVDRGGMVGTNKTFIAGYHLEEVHTIVALRDSIFEYIESRGGLHADTLRGIRTRDIEAASVCGRRDPPKEGDILFDFDMDMEIAGETWHMCEYCVESRK